VIQRGAFSATIEAWRRANKSVPLVWDHESSDPERLIGTVDPRSLKETRDGLIAEARLDLDGSETARAAWRAVKSDSIGVSFGYLVTDKEEQADGTRLLKGIDLYEISLTATPMHGDTRVVSWKSAAPDASARSWTDADWDALRQFDAAAERAHQKQRRDQELEQWIREETARIEKKEAKAARAARVKVKSYSLE
jgi:HK97 family phage prohead protease